MNAIHIDRLHFKGRESQRQIAIADLERVAWPYIRDREYLFIHRLHAVKPAGRLAASLAEQAEVLRRTAVPGWQADADSQPAVYFADYAELLACLSRDLLQKKRGWYWRQWADLFDLPVETALSSCWRQQQRLIPALIGKLAAHDQLRRFCAQLTEPLAEQLCRAVYPQWRELKQSELAADSEHREQPVPERWLAPWLPVLAGQDSPAWVVQLAALVAVREWHPLKRQATELAPVYRAVFRQLQAISSGHAKAMDSNRHISTSGDNPGDTAATFATELATVKGVEIAAADFATPLPAMPGDAAKRGYHTESAAPANPVGHNRPGSTAEVPVAGRHAQAESGTSAVQAFSRLPSLVGPDAVPDFSGNYPSRLPTQQGGIFYLLNFLNQPSVQASLLSEPVTRDYPSAWGWLRQLAVAMEWDPEPGLENLFAFFCGYDRAEQLRQLPAMPQMPDLLRWGRQRYGAALFSREVFAVPALVETDACHVDVFYALDSVNLDVRRLGLDIDPGWLPWLGKVVQFHYGASPLV